MSKSSSKTKSKKNHAKRVKNAILRSQTVFYKSRGGTVDEAEAFRENWMANPSPFDPAPLKNDVIKLHDPRDGSNLSVVCSCGWDFGPDPSNIKLGREAIAHSNETGHVLRSHE